MAKLTEIKAGEFGTRADLEKYVSAKFGLTTDPKQIGIKGTEAELRRLNLSDGSVFWGMLCLRTDGGEKPAGPTEKIGRGKRTDFGIENRENPKRVIEF